MRVSRNLHISGLHIFGLHILGLHILGLHILGVNVGEDFFGYQNYFYSLPPSEAGMTNI